MLGLTDQHLSASQLQSPDLWTVDSLNIILFETFIVCIVYVWDLFRFPWLTCCRARPIIGYTDIFSRYRYRYRYIGSDITNIGIGIIGIGIGIC